MAKAKKPLTTKATYVQWGYGQVEDNKLSAKYNGKIFAQLPCKKGLDVVENGMFLAYDYAHKLVVTPSDDLPEPMLVFNEVKVYEPLEGNADFAMLADNYEARVYNATGDSSYKHYLPMPGTAAERTLVEYDNGAEMKDTNEKDLNPYGMMRIQAVEGKAVDADLESNSIVPRLFKTDVGDIMTTNTIAESGELKVGDTLKVGTDGYLAKEGAGYTNMEWTVVKVYNMPDLQKGVKIMRTK